MPAAATPPALDLILRGGTVVSHEHQEIADIGIADGKIATIGDLSRSDAETVSITGLHVLPGVIDSQVHFREPGNEHKEDLLTGSRAAVLGGVTGVFEMPNTDPPTTSPQAIADKITRATGRMFCDFAFYGGASPDNISRLAAMEASPGCCGIKVFMGSSTGTLLVHEERQLEEILRTLNRRAAFHAEDESRLRQRADRRIAGDVQSHPRWRDVKTALLATDRLLRLARKTGAGERGGVHVLHVSTGEEMDLLRKNRDIASVEVTPQHLTLAAPDCYDRLGTRAQMNPPLRDAAHRDALWRAIADRTVDVIGSDHAPHTLEEKNRPYPDSPAGMPGVQTLVPVMLNHVNEGRLSLADFVRLSSHGPARLFSLAGKGRIAPGFDADLTIVDLKAQRTIDDAWIASRCQWTPFHGVNITGWPVGTLVRGRKVMWEEQIDPAPHGRPIKFRQRGQFRQRGT